MGLASRARVGGAPPAGFATLRGRTGLVRPTSLNWLPIYRL